MCYFCCSLQYYQSFMRNQEGIKAELQKIVHRRIYVRDITFLTAYTPLYVIFYYFLCLLPPPFQVTYLLNGPYIKGYIILLWLIFCVMISWVSNIWKFLQLNTSWLLSLKWQIQKMQSTVIEKIYKL